MSENCRALPNAIDNQIGIRSWPRLTATSTHSLIIDIISIIKGTIIINFIDVLGILPLIVSIMF